MSKLYILENPGRDYSSISSSRNDIRIVKSPEELKSCYGNDSVYVFPAITDGRNSLSYNSVEAAIGVYIDLLSLKIGRFQICILSDETRYAFFMHCPYASFLRCPNVRILQDTKSSLSAFLETEFTFTGIDFDKAVDLLREVRVKAPSSYKSHHSITNEWSIYKWSKSIGISDIPIAKEVEESLFFKYLALTDGVTLASKTLSRPDFSKVSGRLLLIDDEADKGWDAFFRTYLADSGIDFQSIPTALLKGEDIKTVVKSCSDQISEFDPDVIILDMRLNDRDFDVEDPDEYSGIQMLTEINKINRGIQVIGFTASNKVLNYLEWQKRGIDGVIIKESSSMSSDRNYTKRTLNDMGKMIIKSFDRASFLKDAFLKMNQISSLISIGNFDSGLKNTIETELKVAFRLLLGLQDSKFMGYSYLQLFKIIEAYANSVFISRGSCRYIQNGSESYKVFVYNDCMTGFDSAIKYENHENHLERCAYERCPDTNFIMSCVLIFLFGLDSTDESNWAAVRDVRNNKAAHPEKGTLSRQDYVELLDFMIWLFDQTNMNPRSIDEALE